MAGLASFGRSWPDLAARFGAHAVFGIRWHCSYSQAGEFPDVNPSRTSGDHVSEGIQSVIAAFPFFVDIGLDDIARTIGVVLSVRQGFEKALSVTRAGMKRVSVSVPA